MLHLHFVAADNWCRATEMGSAAATVKEQGQSGWSETWNDCVLETQAISSGIPLRETDVLRNNAGMMDGRCRDR